MAMYQNQRTVRIDKKISGIYLIYGEEEMAYACSALNGSGFKVWCYLLKNKDGILWDISPADAKHKWGIKRTTFHDGLRELKEKGFIDFDENVIHQKSIYQGCENRTPSAKELYDIRTPSYTETEQETCENQHRNNITNNIKINKRECLNDNVEPLSFHPAEEFVF